MTNSKTKRCIDKNGRVGWVFDCPGCGNTHVAWEPTWSFNGDLEKPTFRPSILMTSGHYTHGHDGACWCNWKEIHGEEAPFECQRCHSYVTDGQIQFLDDCSHHLKGKTVELPNISSDL